ncbi:putative DNA methyltransferase 1-associated protein 1 [Apostichopus japonicus]|uniref:DNA methyltransferase 1-associated protein 1 n=1 Tax=Stichopus japonicus TaxID=307972 RepID=A0A2G8KQA3_STIJA|nr:putative DNA methyltransferase 1-associated protein 1 [Apostichopus japonicus]
MHREVYALLYSDKKDPPPLIPTDTQQGYKQMKAKLGRCCVRPWKWMPFTNPARKDGAIFYHWRRAAEEGKDYPFAKFNKAFQIPKYTDQEYQSHLHDDKWTRPATDHLFELSERFDARWIVIEDRFDHLSHGKRSVEDIKDRYYNIVNKLSKVRSDPNLSSRAQQSYDAEHERKRKEQLNRLFDRTTEQVEEEEMLIQELKRIEFRKKEREKKAQDLQKLITAADNSSDLRRTERKIIKKKLPITLSSRKKDPEGCMKIPETGGIKFPDIKQSGVYLRSQKKKTKAIEHLLDELGIPIQPMPTDEICQLYNDLRSDMVLLYELKLAHANCEFEMQTLRHRYEALAPGKLPSTSILTPASLSTLTKATEKIEEKAESNTPPELPSSPSKVKKMTEIIDVVATTPQSPSISVTPRFTLGETRTSSLPPLADFEYTTLYSFPYSSTIYCTLTKDLVPALGESEFMYPYSVLCADTRDFLVVLRTLNLYSGPRSGTQDFYQCLLHSMNPSI